MNCCNNNHDNGEKQKNNHKGHMPHIWMIALCCGAPLIILLLVPIIGNVIPSARNVLISIVPFLCPLIMLLMMPMMHRGNKEKQTMHNHDELKEIEDQTG